MKPLRVLAAERFCQIAHAGQKRKYHCAPYYSHCFEVAALVRKVYSLDEDPQIVALLHDVAEDTKYTLDNIEDMFGYPVRTAVFLLTNTPKKEGGLNRAERKRIDAMRLAGAPGWVQTVKVADLISNTRDITLHDKEFAKVYMREKRDLLKVLVQADKTLMAQAQQQLDDYFRSEGA